MRLVDLHVDVVSLPSHCKRADRDRREYAVAIVRLETDNGITGIGEASCAPHVVRAILEAPGFAGLSHGIRSVLIGRDPLQIAPLWEDLYKLTLYCGQRGAYLHSLSAIDIALWDIFGKATGLPIHTLLGGAFRRELPTYRTELMPSTSAEVRSVVAEAVADGWTAIKLGWLPDTGDPTRDDQLVAAAREAAGPDVDLMIDVGERWRMDDGLPRACPSWDVRTALARLRGWERHRLAWVEEPLPADDVEGYRRLGEKVRTPIAAGEQETTRFGIHRLLEAGVDIAQCDVARVGGLTEARRVVGLAADRNRAFAPHCYGSDLQLVASAHLAAAAPTLVRFEYPATIAGTPLVYPRLEPHNGFVSVPHGPGLGVELDTELLEALTVPDMSLRT